MDSAVSESECQYFAFSVFRFYSFMNHCFYFVYRVFTLYYVYLCLVQCLARTRSRSCWRDGDLRLRWQIVAGASALAFQSATDSVTVVCCVLLTACWAPSQFVTTSLATRAHAINIKPVISAVVPAIVHDLHHRSAAGIKQPDGCPCAVLAA